MSGSISWPIGSVPVGADPTSLKRLKAGKSPTDVTVINCDFSGALAAIDCDTLSQTSTPSVAVYRNDGGASDCYALGTPAINSDLTRIAVWTAGGTAGFEYLFSVTVMSADGQTLTRSFILPCTIR